VKSDNDAGDGSDAIATDSVKKATVLTGEVRMATCDYHTFSVMQWKHTPARNVHKCSCKETFLL
jgi:hypothetical protein